MRLLLLLAVYVAVVGCGSVEAADVNGAPRVSPAPDAPALRSFADHLRTRHAQLRALALDRVKTPEGRLFAAGDNRGDMQLMAVDDTGHPVFYATQNIKSAQSIGMVDLWPGGSTRLDLSGRRVAFGELGIWDRWAVLADHREFGGRVLQMDDRRWTGEHATHVAGTMVAAGIVTAARGMAYEAQLAAYDNDFDSAEMADAAAAGMLASNHSYVTNTGFAFVDGGWHWFADTRVDTLEDYKFGFYGWQAATWDSIAYLAPAYSIVKVAGNFRINREPPPGRPYRYYDHKTDQFLVSVDPRRPNGREGGYETISGHEVGKNMITVGAVFDLADGYSGPEDVTMTDFSSWGPTDDGRIKPDLVAPGVSVFSCSDEAENGYTTMTGTSSSAPSVAASIALLTRHYRNTHRSETPLASTVKALLVQSAHEAGDHQGPDYRFGWGLVNLPGAAEIVTEDGEGGRRVVESVLEEDEDEEYIVFLERREPARFTLAWTDLPGHPVDPPELNPLSRALVHDLDLRVEPYFGGDLFTPWILDKDNPAAPPQRGNNTVDNVEQVSFSAPWEGFYRVTVSCQGRMVAPQQFSLVGSTAMTRLVDSPADAFAAGTRFLGTAPNPVVDRTRVLFTVGQAGRVKVEIFDLRGRLVRTLVDEWREAENAEAIWDRRDDDGRPVPAGIYFGRLTGAGARGGPAASLRLVVL